MDKSMAERLATLATPATSRAHQRFSAVATCFSYWRHWRHPVFAVATFPVSPLWKNETGDGKTVGSQGLSPLSPVFWTMTQVDSQEVAE